MPYIIRNAVGVMCGHCTNPPGAGNKLPDGSDEVVEFYEDDPNDPAYDPSIAQEVDAFKFKQAGLDPEGLAKKARADLDAGEAAAVKADNQVQTFLNMTPAELDAWVEANIPAGGQRTAFKVLGRIALAAGRGRVLR